MSDEKYKSESQQRIIKVMFILSGHEINGLAPGEIAKALHETPSKITRVLANLKIAGVAEQLIETERWRLSPKTVQIAIAHFNALDKAESKLREVRNRFSRTPN